MKYKKIAAVLLAVSVFGTMTAGCGQTTINQTAVAATLDDKEISMGVANFVAQYQAVQYDSYLLSYYGEDMWTSDSGDGTTMTDTVKDGVMESLEEMYLLDAHMSDYNVELTEDEKKAITAAAEKFISDNSSNAIQVMGASQENVEEMLRLNTVQNKMQAAIEDDIDTKVSKEEMAQKTISYVEVNVEDTSEGEDTSEEESTENTSEETTEEQNKAAAQKLLDSIKKAENLETTAKQNGYEVKTASYGSSDLDEDENSTALPVAVLEAADQLKDGELASEIVEGDDGVYYVIRMDNTDDKDAAKTKKESILSDRRSDHYDEVLQEYKDNCKWEVNDAEWKKVNFDELYTVASTETNTEEETTDADSSSDSTTEETDAADTAEE